jgi:hypothetical protein
MRRAPTKAGQPEPAPRIGRALFVLPGPLRKILAGTKTWEIRSRPTKIRGPVGLIESGSGTIVGTCTVVGCVGPLTRTEAKRNARKAGFPRGDPSATGCYAWIVERARRLPSPVPYRHPRGAIIWVRLTPSIVRRLPVPRATRGARHQ